MAAFDDLTDKLQALERRQLYRRRRPLETPPGRVASLRARELLNFCSNDYLGLASDPRVAAAFKAGIDRWGSGSGASPLVTGHTTAHAELEDALADFTRRPRALLFGSGYAANVGTLHALLGPNDHVFQDRLNHASLLDGGWLSRANFNWYAHADAGDLDAQLTAMGTGPGRRLLVSDGTFSMDGDLCPLDALIASSRLHDTWLMIDDAHGLGVHGPNGCGVVDPARYGTAEVPVLVGTLGKAFGTAGAFVAGSEALIETLIQRARHYIYSTAPPPALAVATLESLAIAREEGWRREHLVALIQRFRAGCARLPFRLLPSSTPIQPLIVGESADALVLSAALEQRGVLVTPIRPPTVPAGTARLRITLSAAHTTADVDRLLSALGEVATG